MERTQNPEPVGNHREEHNGTKEPKEPDGTGMRSRVLSEAILVLDRLLAS